MMILCGKVLSDSRLGLNLGRGDDGENNACSRHLMPTVSNLKVYIPNRVFF